MKASRDVLVISVATIIVVLLNAICCLAQPKSEDSMIEKHHTGILGWSVGGQLTTGKNQPIPFQCKLEKVGQLSISFDVQSDGTPRAEALISFFVQGNNVTRRVSIGKGTTIAGVGESVSMQIMDVTPSSISTGTVYNVSAQVAVGTRSPVQQPPTLSVIDNATGATFQVAALGSRNIVIPQDAGIISVFTTAFNANNVALVDGNAEIQQSNAAGILKAYDARNTNEWIPVTPGATTLTLNNHRAAGDILFSVTFGIDG